MGEWRYYAQRAGSGLWLDTNVQLTDPEFSWKRSAPNSGKALIAAGTGQVVASDGQNTWGKFNTLLFAEEDGKLAWAGICAAATPDDKGTQLELMGINGWLQRVPYEGFYSVWRTNLFDTIRHLVAYSKRYEPGFDFTVPNNDSIFTVGDAQPPNKPKQPARRKGETKSEWQGSKRYDEWQDDIKEWNEKYGNRKKFEIAWFEAPYIGEEIDSLVREFGIMYRERVAWADKGNLIPRFYFDFADDLKNRRTDIAFIDGMNIAKPLDPKEGGETFANHVLGLGAGDGRDMIRASAGVNDGRLYQAQYAEYKSIRNKDRLRNLAAADLRILANKDPRIGTVEVFDVPGYADPSTLRVGDEVRVISQNVLPNIDLWCSIVNITRQPVQSTIKCDVEVVA